jgi:hypothetical protein
MQIRDLLNEIHALDDDIQVGDEFELEFDDFVLETVVLDVVGEDIILAIDDVAMPFIPVLSENTLGKSVAEAKYQGRTVPLGKPMKGDVKKSKVYVKNPSTGKVVKVNFGDKNMRIKKSLPGHRKSFRARHHCENPGPRTKARYWSCRAW